MTFPTPQPSKRRGEGRELAKTAKHVNLLSLQGRHNISIRDKVLLSFYSTVKLLSSDFDSELELARDAKPLNHGADWIRYCDLLPPLSRAIASIGELVKSIIIPSLPLIMHRRPGSSLQREPSN